MNGLVIESTKHILSHTINGMDIESKHIQSERVALGERIAKLRSEQGLSQRKLALMIGANHSTLGKMESGRVNFMFDKLERIADALGVKVKDLFEY